MNLTRQSKRFLLLLLSAVALLMAGCPSPSAPSPPQLIVSRVADINTAGSSSPSGLTVFNNTLYFSANDGAAGTQLWKSDGTAIGTAAVTAINPPTGCSPTYMTGFNSLLYFQAANIVPSADLYLYSSNGSAPSLVSGLTKPVYLQVYNGALFMGGFGNGTYGLQSYNGSTITTVKDFLSAPNLPKDLIVFNSTLYFSANDGTNGRELWSSNGTTIGTTMVKDIYPGGASNDGLSVSGMVVFNGALYFRGTSDGTTYQLWKSDGTSGGTTQVTSISGGIDPSFLVVYGTALYFRGTNDGSNYQLWKYDGSSTASAVTTLSQGISGSSTMTVYNGALYFSGNDGSNYQLWKYDGTTASMVKAINTSGDSNPGQFAVFNSKLYFQASDGSSGAELWALSY